MWVRTQDKEALINASSFYIASDINGKIKICTTTECYAEGESLVLGKYDKGRALKVLDMMQKQIETQLSSDYVSKGTRTVRDFVFNMPRE